MNDELDKRLDLVLDLENYKESKKDTGCGCGKKKCDKKSAETKSPGSSGQS